ncbi:hypothetical protein AB6A40_009993 [Gnathostoma spinigerum]|uniref:Uncharacterized protein n=1 Tax=Gnathostoma spinigerum TaxID=75299 RepID=A0ABD6F0M7_9BILA
MSSIRWSLYLVIVFYSQKVITQQRIVEPSGVVVERQNLHSSSANEHFSVGQLLLSKNSHKKVRFTRTSDNDNFVVRSQRLSNDTHRRDSNRTNRTRRPTLRRIPQNASSTTNIRRMGDSRKSGFRRALPAVRRMYRKPIRKFTVQSLNSRSAPLNITSARNAADFRSRKIGNEEPKRRTISDSWRASRTEKKRGNSSSFAKLNDFNPTRTLSTIEFKEEFRKLREKQGKARTRLAETLPVRNLNATTLAAARKSMFQRRRNQKYGPQKVQFIDVRRGNNGNNNNNDAQRRHRTFSELQKLSQNRRRIRPFTSFRRQQNQVITGDHHKAQNLHANTPNRSITVRPFAHPITHFTVSPRDRSKFISGNRTLPESTTNSRKSPPEVAGKNEKSDV